MSSLHIGTLPKISFKNLTPDLYTSNYGNYKIRSIKHYNQIDIEKQSLELFCTKRFLADFAHFIGKHLCWSLHGDLHRVSFEKSCRPRAWRPVTLLKKDGNSFFPVKFVKFLRAPDFKEHLRTTACEFKPVRCIVFIKAMANITSRGKVSFNYHLLFHYSRFNFTIVRNLFPCNSVNNSFRKWEKPLLCYVVKWNLVSALTYFANPPCSWSPSAQLFL